jgi:nicotinamide mononucleotide transporter
LTFTPSEILEIVAVLFTLANVWLAVREKIWTWPTGIVSVLLYLVINWQAHLYANAILQILYFILSIHGWYEWLHGGKNKTERRVIRATTRVWVATVLSGAAITAPIYYLNVLFHDSSPLMDAGTAAYSIVGQVLLNLKITENWIVWAVVDVVYVVIYVQQNLRLTAALYAFFVLLCVKGYLDWRKTSSLAATA